MKYKSCRFIEHGIYFSYTGNGQLYIKHCCNMDGAPFHEQDIIQTVSDINDIDFDDILKKKKIMRQNAKKGIYHPLCEKCWWELKDGDWDDEDYFSQITLAPIIRCNSRCVYCEIGNDDKLYNSKQVFEMFPVIQKLMSENLIRFDGSLRYMGGEPTLISDFEKITDLFVENGIPEIYLPSSGIKYSKAIERACKKIDKCEIFISIDSGRPETYKKIKGINAYGLVLKSLKNYSKNTISSKENVISKYIVVPRYNDNTSEIDEWIKESIKSGIKSLAPDAERTYVIEEEKQRYLKHVYNVIKYAKEKIQDKNINFVEVVYLKMLNQWISENRDKFENDTTDEIFDIDISNMNVQDVKDETDKLIEKNTIWNKPVINLISQKEITEYKEFEKILYEFVLNGFKVKLKTDGRKKSPMIEETLKIGDIILDVNSKGKFAKHYYNISQLNKKNCVNLM